MSVPSGTPIKVALDSEVRIRQVGQPIHGKTTDPVYAFDKLLIPDRHSRSTEEFQPSIPFPKRFELCKPWTQIFLRFALSTFSSMN